MRLTIAAVFVALLVGCNQQGAAESRSMQVRPRESPGRRHHSQGRPDRSRAEGRRARATGHGAERAGHPAAGGRRHCRKGTGEGPEGEVQRQEDRREDNRQARGAGRDARPPDPPRKRSGRSGSRWVLPAVETQKEEPAMKLPRSDHDRLRGLLACGGSNKVFTLSTGSYQLSSASGVAPDSCNLAGMFADNSAITAHGGKRERDLHLGTPTSRATLSPSSPTTSIAEGTKTYTSDPRAVRNRRAMRTSRSA